MIRLQGNKVAIIPIRDPDTTGKEYAYREGQQVRLLDGTVLTAGKPVSLIVPEQAKERTDQGIVKYIGPDCHDVKIGMYVTFSGHSGTILGITDPESGTREEFIIVKEDFIFCEIEDDYKLEVHGLFFRGRDGTFWTATYEMVLTLLAQAVIEHRKHFPLDVKTPKPSPDDYNKMRGG